MPLNKGPLSGVKAVACTMFQAGPVCFSHMADMGAEVIKIEQPGTGELGRGLQKSPSFPLSPYFETNNRGQKSLTLNLRTPEAKEVLYKLVKNADIFGQNFRPGAAERNGFGYEEIKKINPKIVYLSISSYGPHGPNAMLPGTDGAAQAVGGIASAYAQPGQPIRTGQVSVADETAGMTTFAAAMAGLYCAKTTGVGQKIDVSLLGGQIRLMGFSMTRTVMLPPQQPQAGGATRIVPGAVPNFNANFSDKDGKPFMFQVVGEDAWAKGMTAAGLMPKLKEIGAEKLGDVATSREKQTIFLDTMNKLFATDTREKWVKAMREADIICAPINTLQDAAVDPDVVMNNYVVEVQHPKYGKIKEVGSAWEFSETPIKVGVAPELGQHNMEILKSLGYTDAQIADLQAKKAI